VHQPVQHPTSEISIAFARDRWKTWT